MNDCKIDHQHIELVQRSFTKIAPDAVSCSSLFYRRLFELEPSLRQLFKSDIHVQGEMLMKVLAMAVNSLYDLSEIKKDLIQLGLRHQKYGVKKAHYALVGQALILMLQDVLADEFSDELEEAWGHVFQCLAGLMQNNTLA